MTEQAQAETPNEQQMQPREHGQRQLARRAPFALMDELQDEMARFWGRPWLCGR